MQHVCFLLEKNICLMYIFLLEGFNNLILIRISNQSLVDFYKDSREPEEVLFSKKNLPKLLYVVVVPANVLYVCVFDFYLNMT